MDCLRQMGGGSALPKACRSPAKVLHNEVNNIPFSATFISTIEGLLLVIEGLLQHAVDLEQCLISGHAGHHSSSRPAQRCFWSRAAATFGGRSQPAPKRVFAAVTTCMVENFVYSFVWVLVGARRSSVKLEAVGARVGVVRPPTRA